MTAIAAQLVTLLVHGHHEELMPVHRMESAAIQYLHLALRLLVLQIGDLQRQFAVSSVQADLCLDLESCSIRKILATVCFGRVLLVECCPHLDLNQIRQTPVLYGGVKIETEI